MVTNCQNLYLLEGLEEPPDEREELLDERLLELELDLEELLDERLLELDRTELLLDERLLGVLYDLELLELFGVGVDGRLKLGVLLLCLLYEEGELLLGRV